MSARYRLLACEILQRELCQYLVHTKNHIDVTFVEKGLHDMGAEKMSARLQAEIDAADASRYDAILLAYGLCNNGVLGLRAKVPLVIPRAHDCITLLLGSRARYRAVFDENPGTYFISSGWLERGDTSRTNEQSVMNQLGLQKTYEEYAAEYGEENAQFLMETLGGWTQHYTQYTFIDTGAGDAEAYREKTQAMAEEKGWAYAELSGDTSLLSRLLSGGWDGEDFLVVPPGQTAAVTYAENIITATGGETA